jgi:hypothetical protein
MRPPVCRLPVLPLLALGLLALGGELTLPRTCAREEGVPFRQGTQAFRRILYDLVGGNNLKPIEPRELSEDPEHTLLVVLGETEVLDRVPDGLFQFILRGGAALVATDRTLSPERLRGFNLFISGKPVELQRGDAYRGYRGLAECPIARCPILPSPEMVPGIQQLVQTLGGFRQVATNRPSELRYWERGIPSPHLVLRFAGKCMVDGEALALPVWCAAATELNRGPRKGRLLVLSDHSVFINDMLWQQDNDNFDFALVGLEWLTDGGRRDRVLYVEEGLVQTKFDMPLKDVPPPPLPPLGVIVRAVNNGLRGLEEENAFNRMIQNRVEAAAPRRLLQSLALMATLGLALYGLVRIGRARHRADPSAPLLEAVLPKAAPAGTVVEQRRQQMVAANSLWEPARALARHWLDDHLGPQLLLIEERALEGKRPLFTVRTTGGPWRHWSRSRQVGRLWRLAYGAPARRVSRREFAALKRQLAELSAAVAAGALRFEVPATG